MSKPQALKDEDSELRHAPNRATNVVWHDLYLDKKTRAQLKNQHPCLLWFTGLSGAGKSTIANIVEQKLNATGKHTYLLDGDNVRHGLNRDLGFSSEDRIENIRRVGEVGKLFVDAGLITLASFISPFRSDRMIVRELFEPNEFLEVFVSAPLSLCEERDPKGLYKKARQGQIPNFTGVDSPYEPPEQPEVILDTADGTPEECADALIRYIIEHGYID
ncbi:MAG TPA: adenylyl-sulfate kinase [Arenicellales bacterium]|nr:adenylyl-sulfate kinase [Arenicellales bacterium]